MYSSQHLQFHTLAAQFTRKIEHIRQHTVAACMHDFGGRNQGGVKRRLDILADHAFGQPQGAGDLLVGQVGPELQAQAFFCIAYGCSLCCYPSFPEMGSRAAAQVMRNEV